MTAYDVPPTLPSIGGIQNYEAGATQESNLQTNFKPFKQAMTINLVLTSKCCGVIFTCCYFTKGQGTVWKRCTMTLQRKVRIDSYQRDGEDEGRKKERSHLRHWDSLNKS